MEYQIKDTSYETISPGTMGVAQKISSNHFSGKEDSELVFLTKNEIIPCGQNQY